ncbi:MAG: hypothetical protein IVW51_15995 [Thermaceae bacterium]|nr:hypothetical protein [Thermaceae bacterium]
MAVANKLLTAEEFWLLPEGEGKRELVRGEVLEWPPGGSSWRYHRGIGVATERLGKAG